MVLPLQPSLSWQLDKDQAESSGNVDVRLLGWERRRQRFEIGFRNKEYFALRKLTYPRFH